MNPRGRPAPEASDPLVAALLERCTFPAGATLDVAVSGGADSVALLALAVATGADVVAHHVDHGTRPGSAAESDAVALLCEAWRAGFVAHAVSVEPGSNLESRWREARRGVLPEGCLTGHTADDQAETVLLRLMRGTGPSGLAAMSPATHPMLRLRRADTEELCAHLGVEPLEDPSNRSPDFARNRVRHEVVPLLAQIAGRDVVPLLARTAELAADQRVALAVLLSGIDPTDCAGLAGMGDEVVVEVLRAWWTRETAGLPPPGRRTLARMLGVVRHEARSCEVAGGWVLARSANRLRLEPPPACNAGSQGL